MMRPRSLPRRRFTNGLVNSISALAALFGLFMLCWIVFTVLKNGISSFSLSMLTELPKAQGDKSGTGGVANAILGTGIITLIASMIGIPLGLMTGIYLSEFGKDHWLASTVRFCNTILLGIPSIIIGIMVFETLVIPMRTFSGLAGGVALSILMLPVVARTTEDMLTLVPNSLRESSLALGASRWKTIRTVVFRAAKTGLITGTLLAVARVGGETAPLMFTAFNSPDWPRSLLGAMANLTMTVFQGYSSPFQFDQRAAWAASLLIAIAILAVNLSTRLLFRERKR
ncbi:MAG: phosphate ABC transporter permease PstA [Candidatus Brocadiia bacterium]